MTKATQSPSQVKPSETIDQKCGRTIMTYCLELGMTKEQAEGFTNRSVTNRNQRRQERAQPTG